MFIVLEGIDGAGKGRQRSELITYLDGKVQELTTVEFPDHNSSIYNHLIHPALHEEINLNSSSWFLSFALDQLLWQEKIQAASNSQEKYFVADGYFTTNIVYQCLVNDYFTLDQALTFANMFKLPVPDLVIFLDVDPDIAMERKMKEEGHDEGLDIFERSLNKQKAIRAGFEQMVDKQIFGKWLTVDGNKTIEDVQSQIRKALIDNNII